MEITENKLNPNGPQSESPVAKYDPTKRYRWEPNSKFYFSGSEFGVVLNSLRQILSTREAQTIILAERASEILENTLVKAVESGVAKEEELKKAPN